MVCNKTTLIIVDHNLKKKYKTIMQHFQRFDYDWMQRRIVTSVHDVNIYKIAMSEQVNTLLSLILVQRHRKYTA